MTVIWIDSSRFGSIYDTDAQAYISAVEAADGQGLELGVKNAINDFVVGCKADGIWNALKSTFILSGARTINGALVPLKSSMPTPTRFGTEAGWTYGRTTGLKGNGTNNYIETGYLAPVSSAANNHFAFWKSNSTQSATTEKVFGGYYIEHEETLDIFLIGESYYFNNGFESTSIQSFQSGLHGTAKTNTSESKEVRPGSAVLTRTTDAYLGLMQDTEIYIYNINYNEGPLVNIYYDQPFSFYSAGDFLDLAFLTIRVSTLITDISTALS
jgi:hypothetical protein